jgi:putative ABC transport system permease protein
MWFLTVVARNLFRRKARSLLTIIGTAVAIGTVVALLGVVQNFQRAFLSLYDQRGVDLVIVRGGGADRSSSFLPERLQSRFEALPHVASVTPGMFDMISFPNTNLLLVPLSGRKPNSLLLRDITIKSGRVLQEDDEKCAILGTVLARNMGKNVGDTITVYEENFKVVGIFESFTTIENGAVFIPLKDLQRLMGREGLVTGFLVVLDSSVDKPAVANQIRQQVETMTDDKGRPLKLTALSPLENVVTALQFQIMKAVSWLMSGIALILGSVGMVNTMVMTVFERTKEIGILRAIGWARLRILWLVLWESWFICLGGAVVGIAGAYAIIWGLSFHPTVGGVLPPWIPPDVLWEGVIVAFIMGFVGGIYPALRATRLVPTEAIRHE